MSGMNQREIDIIEAAFRIFSRYSVQRTTMNDIAKEAGISRQTLYNSFSNKDEVLIGTIRLHTERTIQQIEEGLIGLADPGDLGAKLDLLFEFIAIQPYEIIHASPNAESLLEGMNAASDAEIAISNEKFRELIEKVLLPHAGSLEDVGLTLHQLSDMLRNYASAVKNQAEDLAHLKELLLSMKKITLSCVGVEVVS